MFYCVLNGLLEQKGTLGKNEQNLNKAWTLVRNNVSILIL